jgi:hypothetical protein
MPWRDLSSCERIWRLNSELAIQSVNVSNQEPVDRPIPPVFAAGQVVPLNVDLNAVPRQAHVLRISLIVNERDRETQLTEEADGHRYIARYQHRVHCQQLRVGVNSCVHGIPRIGECGAVLNGDAYQQKSRVDAPDAKRETSTFTEVALIARLRANGLA